MLAYTYVEQGKFALLDKPKPVLQNDRDAAVKGLTLHPLVNDFELAETLSGIFFKEYASFIHMNEALGQ